jgi:hypothetical protein
MDSTPLYHFIVGSEIGLVPPLIQEQACPALPETLPLETGREFLGCGNGCRNSEDHGGNSV